METEPMKATKEREKIAINDRKKLTANLKTKSKNVKEDFFSLYQKVKAPNCLIFN